MRRIVLEYFPTQVRPNNITTHTHNEGTHKNYLDQLKAPSAASDTLHMLICNNIR